MTPLDARWLSLHRAPLARVGTAQFSSKMPQWFSCGLQRVGNLLSGAIFTLSWFFSPPSFNFCQGCPPEGANSHRLGQPVARLFLSSTKSPNRECGNMLGAVGAISGYGSPAAKGALHFWHQQPWRLDQQIQIPAPSLICHPGALTLLKRFVRSVWSLKMWSLQNPEQCWTIPDYGLWTFTPNFFTEVGGLGVWYSTPCSTA